MHRARQGIAALVVAVSVLTGIAASASDDLAPGQASAPYVMARAEVRSVTSSTGAAYRVYVGWPEASPPETGYPVLYMLDGDDMFAVAKATADRYDRYARASGHVPGIVVGIGYPEQTRRSLDYTPDIGRPEDDRGNPIGGAAAFRAFLADDLMPLIAQEQPVDPARQTLMGHSYGGLFVLDTFLTRPELFDTYVASSPSIWFGGRAVLKGEVGLAQRLVGLDPRTLVITAGQYEQDPPPWVDRAVWDARKKRLGAEGMVDASRALVTRLSTVAGVTVYHRVFAGETHGSVVLPAIGNAFRFAFGGEGQ